MYLAAVLLTLLVLPAASVAIKAMLNPGAAPPLMALVGKWFTFWAVGVRLFLAGAMQTLRPQFTAESIFAIKDQARTRNRARGRASAIWRWARSVS